MEEMSSHPTENESIFGRGLGWNRCKFTFGDSTYSKIKHL